VSRRHAARRGSLHRMVAGAALAGVAAWIVIGAVTAPPPPAARAQTADDTAIQLRRVQHADFVPARHGHDPVFILAIGSDARPGICMPVDRCLADSLHLIGINPEQGAATIVGFPRDSHVPIPGVGTERINNALFHGGPELVVRTVEQLTGISIDYYLLASFAQVIDMVDRLGGLEVDVPYPMNDSASGAVFPEGRQTLTGEQVLAFSRNRKDTPNGDFSRSENQGLVLLAALERFQEDFGEDPSALFRWIAVGSEDLETDLGLDEVFELMLTSASIDPSNVNNLVLKGSVGYAGSASVVFLGKESEAVFADMRKDGLA
jgi:polyisoprenyl-teichoic acid--peptidoglycan teichoic acid transferase